MTDQELAEYLMTLPAKDRLAALERILATTRRQGVVLAKHSWN